MWGSIWTWKTTRNALNVPKKHQSQPVEINYMVLQSWWRGEGSKGRVSKQIFSFWRGVDSIAVSVFVVVLADFDKHWDELACLVGRCFPLPSSPLQGGCFHDHRLPDCGHDDHPHLCQIRVVPCSFQKQYGKYVLYIYISCKLCVYILWLIYFRAGEPCVYKKLPTR